MTAMRLIIWRHGRTEWNATGRFQGQADIGLDDLGRQQAADAAAVLSTIKIDSVVASDLSRARDTAQTLADLVGLEVSYDPRLREIHVGSWEGLTAQDIADLDPDFAPAYTRGEDVRRSASGESTTEVARRVGQALRDIVAKAADGSTVLAVMHGLAGKVGTCWFLDLPYRCWHSFAGMDNCHWIDLRNDAGSWRLHGYNLGALSNERAERPVVPMDHRLGDAP